MSRTVETGALPLTDSQRRRQDAVCSAANPYRIDMTWAECGEMPTAKWSSDFDTLLEQRAKWRHIIESQGKSVQPWDIYLSLTDSQKKSSVYAWNQGSRPSCSCHGAAHAMQAAQLYSIRRYASMYYEAVNPIYSFFCGRGGNYAGGLDVQTTAEEINGTGMFPVSAVGTDNISVTTEGLQKTEEASRHQAGIIRVEDNFVDKIFRLCEGMCACAFAASGFYSSASNKNGVRVSSSWSGGGHMQAFTAWQEKDGTEYVFCQNSHGDVYGSTGTEPQSGSWCTRDQVERYSQSFSTYGYPLVIFAEGDLMK